MSRWVVASWVALVLAGCEGPVPLEEDLEWLFVQSAGTVTLADGVLTLKGVSPTTTFVADRPKRIAAHALTADFVAYWQNDKELAADPPVGTLSIVTEETADDIVLTLSNPKLDRDVLRYDVSVLDGRDRVQAGPASLFADVIGAPLTPLSAEGVARLTTQRTVRRIARPVPPPVTDVRSN